MSNETSILVDDFDSYVNTSAFLKTWKSRSKDYKKILKNNSYYYYIREDKGNHSNKYLCSSLREYPKGFIRTDLKFKNIKMVMGDGDIKSVTMYKDYWSDEIKIGKLYHKKGRDVFLEWDWIAYKLPEGASERKKGLNDNALSVYAILYTGWLRFRTIKYVWSSTNDFGLTARSLKTKNKRVYIVNNNKDKLGVWGHKSINLSQHIRDFLPDHYDDVRIVGIAVMADSDDVKNPSQACIDNIRLTVSTIVME